MPRLVINFRFGSSAQGGPADLEQLRVRTDDFARILVRDVALNYAGKQRKAVKASLARNMRKVVLDEITRMARDVSRGFILGPRQKGPYGGMSISGNLSQTAARSFTSNRTAWNRQDAGISWAKRSKKYLQWKSKKQKSQSWWSLDGGLIKHLSSQDFYLQNFGPIEVSFVETTDARELADFAGESVSRGFGAVSARPRGRGRPSRNKKLRVMIGTVRVTALGKITANMLPSLATGNPSDAKPRSKYGIANLIPKGYGAEVGAGRKRAVDVKTKLTGPAARGVIPETRFALEPFFSFYLTRAIPNAVWRRLEDRIN